MPRESIGRATMNVLPQAPQVRVKEYDRLLLKIDPSRFDPEDRLERYESKLRARVSLLPHSSQNCATASFSCWHAEHFIWPL